MKNIALLSSFILLLLLVSCSKKEAENVSNVLTQPVAQETIEQNEEIEMTTDENMQ